MSTHQAYSPDISYAYEEMSKELERLCKKTGRVSIKQKRKHFWGEKHLFEFTVKKSMGIKVLAVLHYEWGANPVIKLKSGVVGGLSEFIENFDKNFEKKRKNFRM